MAFMMPVVKNDYDIYSNSSSRKSSSSTPVHQRSRYASLSCSPGNEIEEHFIVRKMRGSRRTSECLDAAVLPRPKSGSQGSIGKFHSALIDKLRRLSVASTSKDSSR